MEMKILNNIKECLLHFNYPLSNSMNEQELGDIFHISNRCFLISWMLKLLDDAYKDIVDLEENKKNKEVLGNLIHELGFCSKKEHLPFMTGELDVNKQKSLDDTWKQRITQASPKRNSTFLIIMICENSVIKINELMLPMNFQLEILYKMFKFIKLVKQSSPEENSLSVSNEEIAILTKKNVNLFPMYGDIKTSKSAEIYTNETRLSEDESEGDNNSTIVSEVHNNIGILLEGLRECLPKLEVAAQNLPKDDKAKCNEKIIFHPSFRETLSQCNEYMKEVNQFVKDIDTIEEFIKYEPNSDKGKSCPTESKELLKILWEEIFVTLRYQNIKGVD